MRIHIVHGIGRARAEIAALDQALMQAGIGDFNLIYLSSVVPENSEIVEGISPTIPSRYGDRLYVVIAKRIETRPGRAAWAGLGWVQDPATGRGMFAECDGDSRDRVEAGIREALAGMAANRAYTEPRVGLRIEGAKCESHPACVIVAAVFTSATWS